MDVQITRSSGVATTTSSEAEVRRFMASSRAMADEMRRALREAMEQPGQAEPAKPKEPAKRAFRFPGVRKNSTSYGVGAARRKDLGLDP